MKRIYVFSHSTYQCCCFLDKRNLLLLQPLCTIVVFEDSFTVLLFFRVNRQTARLLYEPLKSSISLLNDSAAFTDRILLCLSLFEQVSNFGGKIGDYALNLAFDSFS
jgi:hypothetical protein